MPKAEVPVDALGGEPYRPDAGLLSETGSEFNVVGFALEDKWREVKCILELTAAKIKERIGEYGVSNSVWILAIFILFPSVTLIRLWIEHVEEECNVAELVWNR